MRSICEDGGLTGVGLSVAGPPPRPVVCFPFVGHLVGGSHLSAVKLIQHLDRARYQPLVVLHRPDGDVAELFREAGIAFEPAPRKWFLEGHHLAADAAFVVTETLRFARFLRRRRVRIVHTNDGRTHATWVLPTKLAGAKLLWHHRKDPEARGLRYLAPWFADRVVSVSRFSAPRPGLFSAARKCTVVHSPFDTNASPIDRAASRGILTEELQCGPEVRAVGFFGSLVERKRPLIFVDAVAEIRARAPDLPLIAPIFGHDRDGLAETVRERAEARGVADCVRLMGFRYPPEPWLAACDALMVPAVDEPFGRTLIEAMLLGTVVVAAACGGNLEAIRDGQTGYLVPPENAAAFAERILHLFRNPAASSAVAGAARHHAVARFGLRQHAEAIMGVYDSMLAAGDQISDCAAAARRRLGVDAPAAMAGDAGGALSGDFDGVARREDGRRGSF